MKYTQFTANFDGQEPLIFLCATSNASVVKDEIVEIGTYRTDYFRDEVISKISQKEVELEVALFLGKRNYLAIEGEERIVLSF